MQAERDPAPGSRTILITGCSSGIGLDAACTLHRRGWRVLATVRREEDAQPLRAQGIAVVLVDLADETAVQELVGATTAFAKGRPLRAVFLNAGMAIPGALEDISRCAWRAQFEANVFGHVDVLSRLLRADLLQQGSKVVFCGSVLGFVGMPMRGAYVATKWALEGIADVLRCELRSAGISVSIIEPGAVQTNFRASSQANLDQWVQPARKVYASAYGALRARLSRPGPTTPDTVSTAEVVAALWHAVMASRPKARYRITKSSRFMAIFKRLAPQHLWDAVVTRAAGDECPDFRSARVQSARLTASPTHLQHPESTL